MYVIQRIFVYLIPALMVIYGSGKLGNIFDLESENILASEYWSLGIGTLISAVILPSWNERKLKKYKAVTEANKFLLSETRRTLNNELESVFKVKDLDLSIRIFRPSGYYIPLPKFLKINRSFKLKSMSALSKDQLSNLSLVVHPEGKAQGLVGQAYQNKKLCYDFQLDDKVSRERYGLKNEHLEITSGTKFVAAAPIFNDSNTKVIAIVTIDSKKRINLPRNVNEEAWTEEWTNKLRGVLKIIHQCSTFN